MLNPGDYIGLLIQVPIVGIFIFFTLKLIGIFMTALTQFQEAQKQRDAQWENALIQRDEQWQDFLKEQREITNNAITSLAARLGEEIKNVAQEVAKLEGLMLAHDAQARNRKSE